MSSAEAAQVGAKTLWIGDIEPWMDENYISSLFQGVGAFSIHNCGVDRLSSSGKTHQG